MEIRLGPITSFLLLLALIGAFMIMGFPLGVCIVLALAVVLYVGYAFPTPALTDIIATKNKVTCSNCHYDKKVGSLSCKTCKVRFD